MFTKTTSFAFSEYGEIVNKSEYKFPQKNIHSTLRIKEKSFTSFFPMIMMYIFRLLQESLC